MQQELTHTRLPLAPIHSNSPHIACPATNGRATREGCNFYTLRGSNDDEKTTRIGRNGKTNYENVADRLPNVTALLGKRNSLREEMRPDRMQLMLQEKLRIEMGDKNIEKNIKKINQNLTKHHSKGSCIAKIAAQGSFQLQSRPRNTPHPHSQDENDSWMSNSLASCGPTALNSCR